jgi:Zn-dependent peptidase ImmA (M78 family)
LVEAKARDWHGFFSADRWEICISASCPPAIFLHVLAHEFKHAKQYLNGKWHQEDNKLEIECDKFAYDFVQLYGTLDATIEELFVGLGQDTSNPVE